VEVTVDRLPCFVRDGGGWCAAGRLDFKSITARTLSPVNPDDGFEEKLTDVSFSSDSPGSSEGGTLPK
jgi:hypothetical protein